MFEDNRIDYNDKTIKYEAVLYPRVSDPKQVTQGSGLKSQEVRGREYAKFLGIPVTKVFREMGYSGELLNRPEMLRLLDFISKPPEAVRYVVIIDDITRLARDYRVHFDLREAIERRGALLDSPSTTFKAVRDADSNYVEGIQALGAQHFREKNAETCRNRIWARLTHGYWPYQAPIGYCYKMTREHGNLLVRDEPQASILQEAFEGYASGYFTTQSEVKRFLENHPEYKGKLADGSIKNQRITELMSNPIYAGYVQSEKLNIPLKKGRHEALISYETFQRIQERRKGLAVAPARKDIHLDFPLRGFVTCGDCEKPLRGCWSKGKNKKYPYYLCQTKDCESYGKSIRRADIEGDFADLLKQMRPTAPLFAVVKAMVFDAWNQRLAQVGEMRKALRRNIVKTERQIEGFLERLVDTKSSTAIRAYERKIEKLEREKLLASERLEKSFKPKGSAEQMLEHPMRFLENPWKLWASGDITLQKLVLRLAFAQPLPYHRNEGYRTPKTTLPFKVLGDFHAQKSQLVRSRRLD